jgi:hypothetical protein
MNDTSRVPISYSTINLILRFLGTLPYQEVHQLIELLRLEASGEPINVEQIKKAMNEKV